MRSRRRLRLLLRCPAQRPQRSVHRAFLVLIIDAWRPYPHSVRPSRFVRKAGAHSRRPRVCCRRRASHGPRMRPDRHLLLRPTFPKIPGCRPSLARRHAAASKTRPCAPPQVTCPAPLQDSSDVSFMALKARHSAGRWPSGSAHNLSSAGSAGVFISTTLSSRYFLIIVVHDPTSPYQVTYRYTGQ